MANLVGTEGDDVIVATGATGYTWGDRVYGQGGNDRVSLGPGVAFVSGPGNDSITGVGGGSYVCWEETIPVVINLAEGWAQDGFGGRDSLSGISEVHLPSAGGTIVGTDAAEMVFCFGGNATIDLGGGNDIVRMWQLNSADYSIRQFGNTVQLTGDGRRIELQNVETLEFSDVTLDTTFRQEPFFALQYESHSFTESQWSEGWWYAGVYNQPQLVSSFAQAVSPIDIDADGDLDLVIPFSRGYRTGVDTRAHFKVLENVDGELLYSEAMTQATPFIAGSRRAETLFIKRYESDALVSVAHDTAIETETRTDIPWRFGDIAIILADPFRDITSELVPPDATPRSQVTGRDTAVDAHSMAVGDVNGDGMDDILVGDWTQLFFLLQTAAGAFTYHTDSFLQSLTQGWGWLEPTLGQQATPGLLIDLHLADLDGDGSDDIVAGWGHATVLSRIFFNNGQGGFSLADSSTLPVSVYGATNTLHMKTFSEDFDADGDLDLLILQSRFDPYYGGNYLQFLENDGTGTFTDATVARLGDPASSPDTFASRLQWTDNWQVLDFNGDGALDIAGHRVTDSASAPLLYVNDGSGHFSKLEIPSDGPRPISWGDFDGDGQFEIVVFSGRWGDSQGTTSLNALSVYELQDPNTDKTVEVLAYDWKAHVLLDSVRIQASPSVAAQTTGSGGSTRITGITDSRLALDVERAVPASEVLLTDQAVNLQDAIAILKMIVGLDVNGAGRALSPYQALAADYDGNRQVQLTDAIGVLKHVVGLTAPSPEWHFASETNAAIPKLTYLSPGALPAINVDLSTATAPVYVGLVAYLSGDVDGSYAGAAGSLDLDEAQPDYFLNLSKDYGLDLAQFGVH